MHRHMYVATVNKKHFLQKCNDFIQFEHMQILY